MRYEPKGDPNVPPSWPVPPGAVHEFCVGCGHWFASRGTKMCPDCTVGTRRRDNRRASISASPFDPGTGAGSFPRGRGGLGG
jgi:hypothetical protein